MNAIERLDAFIQGNDPDRIPVYPPIMSQAARLAGIPYGQYPDEMKSMLGTICENACRESCSESAQGKDY